MIENGGINWITNGKVFLQTPLALIMNLMTKNSQKLLIYRTCFAGLLKSVA
jgi:hypothetical protein